MAHPYGGAHPWGLGSCGSDRSRLGGPAFVVVMIRWKSIMAATGSLPLGEMEHVVAQLQLGCETGVHLR